VQNLAAAFVIQLVPARLQAKDLTPPLTVVKSALRYELGADILTGSLAWIQGPYPAGKYMYIKIFEKVRTHFL
jgi:hypothetical protein